MTGFLSSVKEDLLDRRLLPFVAVVVAALVAALAFVVLGGGSSATPPPAVVSTGPAAAAGLSVTQTTPEKAVAEVTSGSSAQHKGASHNPFTTLPEVKAKTASAKASTPSPTSSSSSSGTTGASGSGTSKTSSGTTTTPPTTPTKPATPPQTKTVYHVAVLFGALPASATPLTPYVDLKLLTPLPSATQPLIVFRGVTVGGKSATFTLVGEAILHGNGACLPSATQCEAIDLQAGQSEQLEYLPASGPAVSYELKVVNITSSKASTSAVKDLLHGESKAGRELLSHDGLTSIPYLHYASQLGVLVFAGHGAFAARAHASDHGRHSR